MQITVSAAPAKTDLLVAFVSTEERRDRISAEIPKEEFDAAVGSTLLVHSEKTFYIGLGPTAGLTALEFRRSAAVGMRALRRIGRSTLTLDTCGNGLNFVESALESLLIAHFESQKSQPQTTVKRLTFWVAAKNKSAVQATARVAQILAQATNEARRIANLSPNVCSPATLVKEARKLATADGLKIQVLDEKALAAARCNGILAVGSGSENPPRLILLRHQGGAPNDPWECVVGKAVTFDTGGLCIKSRDRMHEMVWDKLGGAAIFGVMRAVAELKLKKNVLGVIASAENMPDSRAYRPGDIVVMADGTTVEITDTDAEGRLVLGDAMAHVRKHNRLASIVDIATLTGSVGIALGSAAAGVWSSDSKLLDSLLRAADEAGERIWQMPSYQEYTDEMKGKFALLRNAGSRLGGACTGAAFLKWFAGDVPWAHMDIGETAYVTSEKSGTAFGATGFGVRILTRWLMAVK